MGESPAEEKLITEQPMNEPLITTSFDMLIDGPSVQPEMHQVMTTQPTNEIVQTHSSSFENHPKNIIYSIETVFIENHSNILKFNIFLIICLLTIT